MSDPRCSRCGTTAMDTFCMMGDCDTVTPFETAMKRVRFLEAENAKLRTAIEAPLALVQRQALDEGLWSVPAVGTQSIAEAHLQAELRKLHIAIESNARHVLGDACDVTSEAANRNNSGPDVSEEKP